MNVNHFGSINFAFVLLKWSVSEYCVLCLKVECVWIIVNIVCLNVVFVCLNIVFVCVNVVLCVWMLFLCVWMLWCGSECWVMYEYCVSECCVSEYHAACLNIVFCVRVLCFVCCVCEGFSLYVLGWVYDWGKFLSPTLSHRQGRMWTPMRGPVSCRYSLSQCALQGGSCAQVWLWVSHREIPVSCGRGGEDKWLRLPEVRYYSDSRHAFLWMNKVNWFVWTISSLIFVPLDSLVQVHMISSFTYLL